ncbi:hypothetical protein LEP1GSC151_2301 [Leptospira interrogans serovar Grippotyphosa str. LT2186]|uniref:Uncharacterized protein n=1 Tax=Leptospira interrogans serovar Grippotyphosa str. LT2186 TaxID=1001599 RepID=M3I2W2_LEPIR|nr:hypothetical protein LEP1GSC151_2301 [Leptospira interrogans serovar Grippotyphosa str. LT2186]
MTEAFPLRKVTTASELSAVLGLQTLKKTKTKNTINNRIIVTPIGYSMDKFSYYTLI